MGMERKHVTLRQDQIEYLEETPLNFSKFVRQKVDQEMREDGKTPKSDTKKEVKA